MRSSRRSSRVKQLLDLMIDSRYWERDISHLPAIEDTSAANALLYISSKAPYDVYSAEIKRGDRLYVKSGGASDLNKRP